MKLKYLVLRNECVNKFKFASMNFTEGLSEWNNYPLRIVDFIKPLLNKAPLKQIGAEVENRLNMVPEEWFESIKVAKDTATADAKNRIFRFLNYVKGFEIVAVNYSFKFSIGDDTIEDRADFIFKTNSGFTAVKLIDKTLTLSAKARKADNKPENDPYLLAMHHALHEQFPSLTVEMWSLKGKDDKRGSALPAFEEKEGKNIASITFTSDKAVEASLLMFVNHKGACGDCTKCLYKDTVCQLPSVVKEPEKKVEDCAELQKKALNLTDYQKKVYTFTNGCASAVGVPGCGKTTVIKHRAVRLLKEEGVKAGNQLLVSFTDKAAKQLRQGLQELTDEEWPFAMTINALGQFILDDNEDLIGYKTELADDDTKLSLIKEVLANGPRFETRSYEGLDSQFGLAKFLAKCFEDIMKHGKTKFVAMNENVSEIEKILEAYDIYKQIWEEGHYINYDDQISMAADLLEEDTSLVTKYAKTWKYIVIDEFQDSATRFAIKSCDH